MKINRKDKVEYAVGDEFEIGGRIYRCVKDESVQHLCSKCDFPICSFTIACSASEREDGIGVEFVLVGEKGGEK